MGLEEADQFKAKAEDYVAKAGEVPEECEICGLTKENNSGGDKANKFQHEMGKVHQGFVLLRKWHADLKKKIAERGDAPGADTPGDSAQEKRRDTDDDRGRDRGRDRRNGDSDRPRDRDMDASARGGRRNDE